MPSFFWKEEREKCPKRETGEQAPNPTPLPPFPNMTNWQFWPIYVLPERGGGKGEAEEALENGV